MGGFGRLVGGLGKTCLKILAPVCVGFVQLRAPLTRGKKSKVGEGFVRECGEGKFKVWSSCNHGGGNVRTLYEPGCVIELET